MKSKNGLWILFLLVWACGERTTEESIIEEEITYAPVPEFSADSAYVYIEKQVAFGPRVPNSASHKVTGQWLQKKLESFGWEVQLQQFTATNYEGKVLDLTNIIASHNPGASKRILLAAHWDTRRMADKDSEKINDPIDGANDGGSGVGVLLEIARILSSSELQPEVGVDIIFFDGEDDGEPEYQRSRDNRQIWWCLGSQHWSKNLHESGYTVYFGILLDMVGGKNARFYKEGYSMQYAKNVVDKVWKYGHDIGHSDFFPLRRSEAITDDHLFVNEQANIPMINIIEYSPDYGFGHFHHTHDDNMDLIDKKTLEVVGETVLFTIYQE
ncbi:MAG: M28 family peptidase [Cyclobacteriaceae bacterium]